MRLNHVARLFWATAFFAAYLIIFLGPSGVVVLAGRLQHQRNHHAFFEELMEKRWERAVKLSKSVRDIFLVFISPNWSDKTYQVRFPSATYEEAERLTEYFSEMRGDDTTWRTP